MIEEGKTYKLKKIKGLNNNESGDCTILKILDSQNPQLGKVAYYKTEDGERYVAPVSAFIDPENPEEYSDFIIKMESVMKPMNLDFWKDLQEEASFGGLGAAPCPAMGQVSSTACTVNGVPVEGKSVKKKKNKKKNEDMEVKHEGILEVPEGKNVDDLPIKHFQSLIDKKGYGKIIKALTNLEVWNKKKNPELSSWAKNMIEKLQKKNKNESVTWIDNDGVEHVELDERPSTTLDDIDREETIKNMEAKGLLDTPKTVFARNKGEIDDPEFEDAINILLFGTKDDVDEYKELCATFAECGRYDDFLRFAKEKYGLYGTALDSYNVGADIDENFEIKWLDEDFHEAYERITNLLAKQLDRMNFEYANTEEIIYKKEGAYKYLLKFDNEIGILKFKVTKDDDVIIEKEWQLDEKEDVSPIFSEIEDIYNKYGI